MSEATVKALTDAIYDALEGSDPVRQLGNEQVYEVARLAAQTIESAGTTKAIVRAWLASVELTASDFEDSAHSGSERWVERIQDAITAVYS